MSVYGTGCYTRFSWHQFYQLAAPREDWLKGPIPSGPVDHVDASLLSHSRRGNFDPLSIGFAYRLILRARLTLIRLTQIKEPLVFRRRCFPHRLSLLMPTFAFPLVPPPLTTRLLHHGMLPYHFDPRSKSKVSVYGLMPVYFPRRNARPVSCYALFE